MKLVRFGRVVPQEIGNSNPELAKVSQGNVTRFVISILFPTSTFQIRNKEFHKHRDFTFTLFIILSSKFDSFDHTRAYIFLWLFIDVSKSSTVARTGPIAGYKLRIAILSRRNTELRFDPLFDSIRFHGPNPCSWPTGNSIARSWLHDLCRRAAMRRVISVEIYWRYDNARDCSMPCTFHRTWLSAERPKSCTERTLVVFAQEALIRCFRSNPESAASWHSPCRFFFSLTICLFLLFSLINLHWTRSYVFLAWQQTCVT